MPVPDVPWHYCSSVDLEEWLACLSTEPGEGQNNDGEIICAFHPDWKPDADAQRFMLTAINTVDELAAVCRLLLTSLTSLPDSDAKYSALRVRAERVLALANMRRS